MVDGILVNHLALRFTEFSINPIACGHGKRDKNRDKRWRDKKRDSV